MSDKLQQHSLHSRVAPFHEALTLVALAGGVTSAIILSAATSDTVGHLPSLQNIGRPRNRSHHKIHSA
jgi:hypothetical protein